MHLITMTEKEKNISTVTPNGGTEPLLQGGVKNRRVGIGLTVVGDQEQGVRSSSSTGRDVAKSARNDCASQHQNAVIKVGGHNPGKTCVPFILYPMNGSLVEPSEVD